MAGSSKDIIDSLIAKFHAMSDLCKAFENENGILKVSKTVAGQDGSSTEETKVRFARLVREIDKCSSLLNE